MDSNIVGNWEEWLWDNIYRFNSLCSCSLLKVLSKIEKKVKRKNRSVSFLFVFCIFCFNHLVECEVNPVKVFTWLPEELKEFKWLNSKAGITEDVLSPWSAVEVKQKGKELDIKGSQR